MELPPIIGAIVHYCEPRWQGETLSYKCVAAIVLDVYNAETGNINVRELDNMQLRSCLYSEQPQGGTWHWPTHVHS